MKVTDASGRPVANAVVNWTVTTGSTLIFLNSDTSLTDASGIASMAVTPNGQSGGGGSSSVFGQSTVTATSGSGSATFTLTQGLPGLGTNFVTPIVPTVSFGGNQLSGGTVVNGQIGATASTPVVVTVRSSFGEAIPNVSVIMSNDPTINSGTLECASQAGAGTNTVLTDSTGVATCNLIFGGTPNTADPGQVKVAVGGAYPISRFQTDPKAPPTSYNLFPGTGSLLVQVTPSTPGSLQLLSGTPQTAAPGTALAAPLVVGVQSTAGGPLPGQTVTWTVSPATAGTFGNGATTTTDATGTSSNTFTLASGASGAVTITASVAGVATPATFNITAQPNVTVSGITILSGNNQSTAVNTAFGAPLVVQVNGTGVGAGVPVTFSITGPGTLSATSAATDASGRAQVTVTAGATAGVVNVTVTSGGASQSFALTVLPPGPALSTGLFANAADFQRNALSPCSLATIFATGLTPNQQGMVTGSLFGPLPFVLAGDRLTVGGGAAPILSAGRNANNQEQLTFQVPCDVTPGSSVPVAVTVGQSPAASINLPILAASPGIFQTVMSDGVTRAVAVRPDGSFVSLQNPGRRGENLVVFVTGMGQTNPPMLTNAVAAPAGVAPVTPTGTVVVGMAGGGVPLVSANLSDELVGVWMVTFTVPAGVSTGNNVPFSISVIPPSSTTPISSGTTSLPIQ